MPRNVSASDSASFPNVSEVRVASMASTRPPERPHDRDGVVPTGEPVARSDAVTGDDDAAVLAEMLRTRDLEDEVVEAQIDFSPTYENERAVNRVQTGGKQHMGDAEGDALVRQYQRSVDDQALDPELVAALVEYVLYSSQRPLRRFHAIAATRLQERRSWVVSLLILSEFGRESRGMLRAGTPPTTRAPSSSS